jgi:ankyrin repeat protein
MCKPEEPSWEYLGYLCRLQGHSNILELFIRMDADLSPRAQSDLTPLVAAARSGHSDAVRLLLNSDQAHLQCRDSARRAAKRRGHRSVVQMIASFVRVASVE